MILDTHTCVWLINFDSRLGRQANHTIHQAKQRHEVAFSAISIWEIAMLLAKGRLAPERTALQWRRELLEQGLYEIPVDGAIAARAGALPNLHGDPADRIIIATALGGHQLITDDALILNWNGPIDAFPASR